MSTVTITETETVTRTIPPWNVILLNDDDHSYDYVIDMLKSVFGMQKARAYLHACEVDALGRSILVTTSREHAELKQEQCHAFGPDSRVAKCSGSMSCDIEPA
jgi:ATP-dependent Clp protease adaptor protein ClpS